MVKTLGRLSSSLAASVVFLWLYVSSAIWIAAICSMTKMPCVSATRLAMYMGMGSVRASLARLQSDFFVLLTSSREHLLEARMAACGDFEIARLWNAPNTLDDIVYRSKSALILVAKFGML